MTLCRQCEKLFKGVEPVGICIDCHGRLMLERLYIGSQITKGIPAAHIAAAHRYV